MTKAEEIIDNIARLNSQTWRDREEVRTEIGKLLSELKKILEQQHCVEKLEQIEQIAARWNNDASHSFEDMCKINGILKE